MSRATELAKAEADRVEQEEREQLEDERPLDEPEQDVEDDSDLDLPDDASDEDRMDAFEQYMARHEARLEALMGGDFAELRACTVCNGLGYRGVGEALVDPDYETCATCAGHGYRLTGSLNPMYAQESCRDCGGQGFRRKVPPMQAAAPATPAYEVRYIDPATGLEVPGPQYAPPANGNWAPGYNPTPGPLPGS